MQLLSQNQSYFELQRLRYRPDTLQFLQSLPSLVIQASHEGHHVSQDIAILFPYLSRKSPQLTITSSSVASSKPVKIGVFLSGGQAPGSHNVIIGLHEALKKLHPQSKLLGFLKGPLGLIQGLYKELDGATIYQHYNSGGFDLLYSSREKIRTSTQRKAILQTVQQLRLDGLLIIGGNQSQIDAALLAEYFLANQCDTAVISVPKTIDGDLKNDWIDTSLGFHTACRTYTEIIGNLAKDLLSTEKYYHMVRVMGRSTSYVAMECALQTQPNITLLSNIITKNHHTLTSLSKSLAKDLVKRFETGKNYGLILMPEGLLTMLQDTRALIHDINQAYAHDIPMNSVISSLPASSQKLILSMPEETQQQLLRTRDSFGMIRVSKINVEFLLSQLIKKEIQQLTTSMSFQTVTHFLGYEARASYPSNFDANYGMILGIFAGLFLSHKHTGYMITINHLSCHYEKWRAQAIPLIQMLRMNQESMHDQTLSIITEEIHDHHPIIAEFLKKREELLLTDQYLFPGPIQFFGTNEIENQKPISLKINKG